MKASNANKILFILLFTTTLLQAQQRNLTVDLGKERNIDCSDTLVLTARVSNWVPVIVNSNNYGFNDVAFATPSIGFITGNDGILHKTIDGGTTWNAFKIQNAGHLSLLYFVNSNTGFILSQDKLIKTTDGGNNWESIILPTYGVSMSFTDETTGYYSDGYGRLFTTIDGGKNWTQPNPSFSTSFNKLICLGENIVIGSSTYGIFRTDNRGLTWTRISTETSYDICRASNSVLYAACYGKVLKSADAGITWEKIWTGADTYYNTIAMRGDSGVLAGGNLLAETSDGGKTWNKIPTPDYSGVSKVFYSEKIKFAVGYSNAYKRYNMENLRFEWFSDGMVLEQATSSIKLVPLKTSIYSVKASENGFEGSGSVKVNVDFSNNLGPDVKVACGDSIVLNGSVSEFKNLPALGSDLYFNTFVDGITGFACGINGIYKTTDGGHTWRNIPGVYVSYITGLWFTDKNTGYATSLGGVILKTTDGGESWESIYQESGCNLIGVYFSGKNTGFAYGGNARIVYTNDAGKTWSNANSYFSGVLQTMCFTDSTRGFAAGDKGLLLRADSLGKKWHQVQTGITDDIVSMDFYDRYNGIMAGTNGLIMRTTDGGDHWTKIKSGTTGTFSVVIYLSDKNVMAMGDEILYSEDGGLTWHKKITPQKNYIFSACRVNDKLFTVGRYGEMLLYRPMKDISYSWKAGNQIISGAGSVLKVRPVTQTTYKVSATTKAGCIASDTITVAVKDLGIKANTDRSRITCGDSTLLYYSSWSSLNFVDFSNVESIFFHGDTGIVFTGYSFYKTLNNGLSWQYFNVNQSFQAAGFFNQKTGYAINSQTKRVYKTDEGLTNWSLTGLSGFRNLLILNSQSGFLVGDSGKIVQTNNGGVSWQSISGNLRENLVSIECLHENFLITRSDSGNFYKTADNGQSWSKIIHPAGKKLACVYFLNDATGYGAVNQVGLYRTSDGGKTWQLVNETQVNFKSLFFTDEKKGFILDQRSNSVFETIDGGINLTRNEALGKVERFFFTYPGWVYAHAGPVFHKIKVYPFKNIHWSTTDGSWTSASQKTFVKPGKTSVYYLSGYDQGGCYASDSVLISFDPLKVSAGNKLREVMLGDTVAMFASAGNGNGKWTVTNAGFNKVRFPERNTGYASKSQSLYKTSDGAQTWVKIVDIPGLTDFWFTGKNTGYAIGTELYKTTDGGKTWSRKMLPIPAKNIYFVNARHGYILTYGSIYLETTDYGRTWKSVNLGNDYYLLGINFRNDNEGYISLSDKKFYLKTTNAGVSWEIVNTNGIYPQRIAFADSLNGVTGDKSIYHTTDGGKTWKEVFRHNSQNVSGLRFINSRIGFACFQYGVIALTTNGGASWQTVFEMGATDYNLKDFEFPVENSGYLCSGDGLLAKYSENLKTEFRWEPASLFADQFAAEQKIKAVENRSIQVHAVSGSSCTATDTILIRILDPGRISLLNNINIVETMIILDIGNIKQLTVNAFPENAMNNNIRFYSSDTTVAVVDLFGNVTARKGGQAVIYATSPDGKLWDNCTVNVNYKLQRIGIYPEYAGVEVGGRTRLEIEFEPGLAQSDYNVYVSNPEYVQIVEKGINYVVVTGKDPGYSTVTISANGVEDAIANVFVGPRLYELNIKEDSIVVKTGLVKKLTTSRSPSNLSNDYFFWLSSDTTIAIVNAQGVVKAVRPGKAMVGCFYIFNFNMYDTCQVRVVDYEYPQTVENFVYPNPCVDILNIFSPLPDENISEVWIYNNKGELVLRQKINSNNAKLPVHHLGKGTYVIEMEMAGSGKRKKSRFLKI